MEFEIANTQYLEELSNGNTAIIRQIAELFLEQTPGDIDLLAAYVRDEDWDAAYKQAHYVKPTLIYVGANGLHKEISAIERLAKERQELHRLPAMVDDVLPKLAILYDELNAYLKTMD